ncbi:MAG: carbamoyltransferase HypF [Isosphaera sp.]|nr:carbamoyltransferase HypF [Isosphaera sp.]
MTRWVLWVGGAVQGCGFRPHVCGLARRFGLGGFVRNEGDAVRIEVEGPVGEVRAFHAALMAAAAFASRITSLRREEVDPRGESRFVITPSAEVPGVAAFLPADIATCPACVAELTDPKDRRHRYPFVSCARCGPRYTVVTSLPYDRERTTMAGFALCPDCRREYDDPADRRFHAQTIACPACGPRLTLLDARGEVVPAADPLAAAAAALRGGRIVAVKGLGGFHLACAAAGPAGVAELRRRKGREAKPLAVMAADPASVCDPTPDELDALASPERPIVLVRRRGGGAIADGVAPGTPYLGVMLPYTPLHHLLLREVGGPLVMTSGNRSDEPIAFEDADAVRRLAGLADLFLTHDRPIRTRCDDSVVRVVAGRLLPVRRSRGFSPSPVPLPFRCPSPVLATGGHLKAAFALGHGDRAVLSHHLGDLDGYEAVREFAAAVADYERLLGTRPAVIAHDLHPDYATTRYALDRAAADPAVKLVPVQHHHAHLAACMAENGLTGSVIGVVFDGSGYGDDGTVWGGEFLVGGYSGFRRAGHLRRVALPGGDAAAREPWRVAASHLLDAGQGTDVLAGRIDTGTLRRVESLIARGVNVPLTSSAGRLFDAVAAVVGLRTHAGYEGQAALELEGLAAGAEPDGCYPFPVATPADAPLEPDTRPLIAAVAADVRAGVPPARIARRFHSALAAAVATACGMIRDRTGLSAVVLTGGVFLNAVLLAECLDRLGRSGFRAYRHTLVPPGDGGLCLGQLAVAAAWAARDNPPVPTP